MRIEVAGESALLVTLAGHSDPGVAARVQAASQAARQALGEDLIDLVPSYASLLIIFDPFRCDHYSVRSRLRSALETLPESSQQAGRLVELPAWYAGEAGPDLARVAAHSGLSEQTVIELHSQATYRVYAIGFAPGFAYLGDVDARIATPRLATPRQRVPRGAVAIADRQTAVYPAPSPGGWNLIGLCPRRLFDPAATPCMPVAVGDQVRFRPIDRTEYLALGGELP